MWPFKKTKEVIDLEKDLDEKCSPSYSQEAEDRKKYKYIHCLRFIFKDRVNNFTITLMSNFGENQYTDFYKWYFGRPQSDFFVSQTYDGRVRKNVLIKREDIVTFWHEVYKNF
jgi:hypothetical protein